MKLPQGFRSASVAAGLKSSGALDLTVIENQGPYFTSAAVFTSNKVVAAPVIWSRQVAKGGIVRAIVVVLTRAQVPRVLLTHIEPPNMLVSY
jgi:glutamate N-acetyltransferase/amino-acid N-acetyltransferase